MVKGKIYLTMEKLMKVILIKVKGQELELINLKIKVNILVNF